MNPLRRFGGMTCREAHSSSEIYGSPLAEDDLGNVVVEAFPMGRRAPNGLVDLRQQATTRRQCCKLQGGGAWTRCGPGRRRSPQQGSMLQGPASGVGANAPGGGLCMPTGLPDLWSNPAATALRPEWLASVLTAATTPASTSIENHAAEGEAQAAEGVCSLTRRTWWSCT
jgi:hypothetical protein